MFLVIIVIIVHLVAKFTIDYDHWINHTVVLIPYENYIVSISQKESVMTLMSWERYITIVNGFLFFIQGKQTWIFSIIVGIGTITIHLRLLSFLNEPFRNQPEFWAIHLYPLIAYSALYMQIAVIQQNILLLELCFIDI